MYKAPGHDKINPELAKITASVLADPLVHIYNLSFLQGAVPEKMKVAKVTPISKKVIILREVIIARFLCWAYLINYLRN